MPKVFTPSRLRVLSGLFANLSAGWIGAVFIFPNFTDISKTENQLILLIDIFCATVALLVAFWLEEKSQKRNRK